MDGDGGEEEEHVADPPEQNGGAARSLAVAIRALVVLRLQAHAAAASSVHGRYWRSDHGNTRRDGSGKWPSGGYYDGRCDEALDDESDRQHRGRSGGAAAELWLRAAASAVLATEVMREGRKPENILSIAVNTAAISRVDVLALLRMI